MPTFLYDPLILLAQRFIYPSNCEGRANTDGYSSPGEMAVEMFEEAIEPFLLEMYRLFDLKMHQEAKLYCMGILKGIYDFVEKPLKSETGRHCQFGFENAKMKRFSTGDINER